ncbi:hypothetical protein ASD03_18705 [Ensifer sp. Root127]|nr:hypothetical protein ASD03_18705 [Ensifer sp. Root127]
MAIAAFVGSRRSGALTRLMVHIDRLLREQFERGQQSLKGICVREAGGLVLRLELPAWKSWAA